MSYNKGAVSYPHLDVYKRQFPTKFVALDGLNIHFAATIFDERDSPELAKQIAADYAALAKLGNSLVTPVPSLEYIPLVFRAAGSRRWIP